MPTTPPLSRGVRFRPRSIRGRAIVLVSLLAVLLLVPSGLVAAWSHTGRSMTACGCKHGRRPPPPPPPTISAVDRSHQVRRAGYRPGAGRGEQPPCRRLLGRRPGPAAPEYGVADAAGPGAGCGDLRATATGCVHLSALRVTSAPDSPVVYAGRPLPRTAPRESSIPSSPPRAPYWSSWPPRQPGRSPAGRYGPSRRSAPNWPRST